MHNNRFTGIRYHCGVVIGKTALWICRLFKLGGTTLPGKIALKIYPGLLSRISYNCRIIIVTGTNGKTTTSRIISRILEESGIPYLTNRSGANLLSGITSTFLENTSFSGHRRYQTALLEIDEAATKVVCDHLKPYIITVTNFFRDQLDRYGELYTTVGNVRSAISKCPDATIILNADDSLCVSLAEATSKALYYGINKERQLQPENDQSANSDAPFCIRCKSAYLYDYRTYGHLGGFKCPSCGFSRPEPDIWCELPVTQNDIGSEFNLEIKGDETKYRASIPLPALYNIYNAIAAAATGFACNIPLPIIIEGLRSFECGFGRMENINAGDRLIKMILVKNPTGFNQVMDYLITERSRLNLAFLLNDRIADGTDVSWIWDVDFEKIGTVSDKINTVYTSGDRAFDMALRLKYAAISQGNIQIIKDYMQLLKTALSGIGPGGILYILPTYTAMLDIRRILKKNYNLKEFWK